MKTVRQPERLFVIVLLVLPLLPLAVLVARDVAYDYFGWVNTETPQGSLFAWEVWLIAAVCWGTAAIFGIAHRRQGRKQSQATS